MSQRSLLQPPHTASSGSVFTSSEINQVAVIQPEIIQQYFPVCETAQQEILEARDIICETIQSSKDPSTIDIRGKKNPVLIIVGPEYIVNEKQAVSCSKWLRALKSNELQDNNTLVTMRTNLYKMCSPYNNEDKNNEFTGKKLKSKQSFSVSNGLTKSRDLLTKIVNNHVPIVGQITDNITPQYFSDLYSMSLLSSSLLESQIHRELISGMSYPIGLETSLNEKNDTINCNIKKKVLTDTLLACANQHRFLSVTKQGHIAVVETIGNNDTFIVLNVSNLINEESKMKLILNNFIGKQSSTPVLFDLGAIDDLSKFESAKKIVNILMTDNGEAITSKLLGFVINSGNHYTSFSVASKVEQMKQVNLNAYDDEYQQISNFVNGMLLRRSKEKGKSSRRDSRLLNARSIFKNFEHSEMKKQKMKDAGEDPDCYDGGDGEEYDDQKCNIIEANDELFNYNNSYIKRETDKYKKLFKRFLQTNNDDPFCSNVNQTNKNRLAGEDEREEDSIINDDEIASLEFFKRILGAGQFNKLFANFPGEKEEFNQLKDTSIKKDINPKKSKSALMNGCVEAPSSVISNKTDVPLKKEDIGENVNVSKYNSSITELSIQEGDKQTKDGEISKFKVDSDDELFKNQFFANELINYINCLQKELNQK